MFGLGLQQKYLKYISENVSKTGAAATPLNNNRIMALWRVILFASVESIYNFHFCSNVCELVKIIVSMCFLTPAYLWRIFPTTFYLFILTSCPFCYLRLMGGCDDSL